MLGLLAVGGVLGLLVGRLQRVRAFLLLREVLAVLARAELWRDEHLHIGVEAHGREAEAVAVVACHHERRRVGEEGHRVERWEWEAGRWVAVLSGVISVLQSMLQAAMALSLQVLLLWLSLGVLLPLKVVLLLLVQDDIVGNAIDIESAISVVRLLKGSRARHIFVLRELAWLHLPFVRCAVSHLVFLHIECRNHALLSELLVDDRGWARALLLLVAVLFAELAHRCSILLVVEGAS